MTFPCLLDIWIQQRRTSKKTQFYSFKNWVHKGDTVITEPRWDPSTITHYCPRAAFETSTEKKKNINVSFPAALSSTLHPLLIMPGDKDKRPSTREEQMDYLSKKLSFSKSKATPEVRAQLERLMERLELQDTSSIKEKKAMEDHKFWNTQPVPKHGRHKTLRGWLFTVSLSFGRH